MRVFLAALTAFARVVVIGVFGVWAGSWSLWWPWKLAFMAVVVAVVLGWLRQRGKPPKVARGAARELRQVVERLPLNTPLWSHSGEEVLVCARLQRDRAVPLLPARKCLEIRRIFNFQSDGVSSEVDCLVYRVFGRRVASLRLHTRLSGDADTVMLPMGGDLTAEGAARQGVMTIHEGFTGADPGSEVHELTSLLLDCVAMSVSRA